MSDTKDSAHSLLTFEVIRLLEEAADIRECGPDVLRTICTSLNWSLGEIWLLDVDAQLIRQVSSWHTNDEGLEEFVSISRGITADAKLGLPGRVLAAQHPLIIRDLAGEVELIRKEEAGRAGLKSGLGFPLRSEAGSVGVLALFGFQPGVELGDSIEETLSTLGCYIGRFLATDVALQRTPAYYKAIVENQCDIVALIGLDGIVHYENAAVERILGYGRRERIGKNVYDLIHPDDVARAQAAFQAGLEDPSTIQVLSVRARCKDGSWIQLEATGRVMVDIAGTRVAVVNSRPLSESREAAETRGHPDVVLTDRQKTVLRMVGKGMTNKQIGAELKLSPYTIKDNLQAAMRKLDCRNRAETVLAATKRGLL